MSDLPPQMRQPTFMDHLAWIKGIGPMPVPRRIGPTAGPAGKAEMPRLGPGGWIFVVCYMIVVIFGIVIALVTH